MKKGLTVDDAGTA